MEKATALVIRLSSLGDIILTQPVLAAIAAAGYAVDLLVKPEYVPLAQMLPGVTRALASLPEPVSCYDLVLDLHGTARARRDLAGVQACKRVRYSKHALERRLLIRPWGRRWPWSRRLNLHERPSVTDWYAAAATQAGIVVPKQAPQVLVSATAREAARVLLQKLFGATERVAVFAPGAKWSTKQWPLDYFGQLAARLEREHHCLPLFVGGAQEAEACRTAAGIAGGRARSVSGQTELPLLAALLEASQLLVANDSGPLHLGQAAGTRVLAFFGPTVAEFGFMPAATDRCRVLERELSCRPCSLHGSRKCPLGHHHCLREITVEEAFGAAGELLKSK